MDGEFACERKIRPGRSMRCLALRGLRVQVEARNSYYYPDVSACCDQSDRDELYVTSPCFIIEVLSPSTASID